MTIQVPIWLQAGTYPARLDRGFIERVLHGSQRVFDGLEVTQTGTGSSTVQIAPGSAAILGSDEENQGMYFVDVIAGETSNSVPAPGAGSRTDIVVLRVNDATAGGPAGDNATIELIEGTTVPTSAILLATIARTAGGAILDASITDSRPLGPYPYGVGTSGPPSVGVEGDLYIEVV
jgi:hypothetical protein